MNQEAEITELKLLLQDREDYIEALKVSYQDHNPQNMWEAAISAAIQICDNYPAIDQESWQISQNIKNSILKLREP